MRYLLHSRALPGSIVIPATRQGNVCRVGMGCKYAALQLRDDCSSDKFYPLAAAKLARSGCSVVCLSHRRRQGLRFRRCRSWRRLVPQKQRLALLGCFATPHERNYTGEPSGQIEEEYLGVCRGGNRQRRFVGDLGAITCGETITVQFDIAADDMQIGAKAWATDSPGESRLA